MPSRPFARSTKTSAPPDSWSREEVEAVVADYLQMLKLELAGQKYNKTAHRRDLQRRLTDRSEGSIELKHQNISAVLLELGSPWILGYKPMRNYQALLFQVVESRLQTDRSLDLAATDAVERPAATPASRDFAGIQVPAPVVKRVSAKAVEPLVPRGAGIKRDYLALETRNRSLGTAGEEFVVQYESRRLHELGAKRLADRVEQVSATRGDGLGYDVLSFETDGKDRLIEVKTTAFGRETPFYLSRTELALSDAKPDRFRLYRLFEFRRSPRMFVLKGPVRNSCRLDPVSYLARF